MILTKRLILRAWRERDLVPFAKMNSDPKVMECFPALLTNEESDRLAKRFQEGIDERGWGFWAVEVPKVANFIGYIGISPVLFEAPFTPAVEVGWRLAHEFWGHGYATEGARAVLKFGFETVKLKEIVSFTAVGNVRSRHVMDKLGMRHDPKDDFDHPKLPEGHPLRRHVLFRLKADK